MSFHYEVDDVDFNLLKADKKSTLLTIANSFYKFEDYKLIKRYQEFKIID